MTEIMDSIASQVQKAYADMAVIASESPYFAHDRILHFRASDYLSPAEAHQIMQEFCQEYNDFNADVILKFPEDCKVCIAREYSVCLYVMPGLKPLPSMEDVDARECHNVGPETRYWWD